MNPLLRRHNRRKDGLTATALTGYKQYKTGRKYLAKYGDWRENKDEEWKLDGVGGVSIMVKADVHRSGASGLIHIFIFRLDLPS
jgi:hypothetical protein